MKNLLVSVLVLSLTSIVWAEENKAEAPVAQVEAAVKEVVSEVEKAPPAPPAQEIAKPVLKVEKPPVPEEVPKIEEKPKETKPFGCVASLKDLTSFHEKEIKTLEKLTKRWNEKIGYAIKRRQDLENDILTTGKEIDSLQGKKRRGIGKEISRLQKKSKRTSKDIKSADKELKSLCKELAKEVKSVTKEAQTALKMSYQAVAVEIEQSQN